MKDNITITVKGDMYDEGPCMRVRFQTLIVNKRTEAIEGNYTYRFYHDGTFGGDYFEGYDGGYASAVLDFLNFLTGEGWCNKLELLGRKMVNENLENLEENYTA